jgi:hypothetical protein
MDSFTPHNRTADALDRVAVIDLKRVMQKLRKDEGWSEAEAGMAESRYRRFLAMRLLNPDFHLVPARDIDKVWHQHILHTKFYFRDCETVFGHYLHHNPGSTDTVEEEHLHESFEKTRDFYVSLFDEPYVDTWLTFMLA